MIENVVRVGNCAGFSGDRVDAAGPVVETLIEAGGPAAIFFEVLAERTIALAQLEKRRDPERGYEPMLELLIAPILRDCVDHGITIVGNCGAANPMGAARCIARLAAEQGMGDVKIAVIEGDDIMGRIDPAGLEVIEADASLHFDAEKMISANVYLGAEPVAEAMAAGAHVVVTGRIADPALALAPFMHHFGWKADDWNRIAAGMLAGHLLECGAQVTGGYFYDPGFKDVPDPANIGFPIAEMTADGGLTIAKAARTGGLVTLETVKEQLLYEIHDPADYITPDVVLDVTDVVMAETGPDRVRVDGVKGRPRPEKLKAVLCYDGGWLGEGEVSFAGPNCLARARACANVLRERVARRQLAVDRLRVDIIGAGSVYDSDDGSLWNDYAGPEPTDLRVRIAALADDQWAADQASREALALLCCGPAGTCGARWRTTQRFMTQSYLVPRGMVHPKVNLFTSRELAK